MSTINERRNRLLSSLDAFTRAYIDCALWSSTDESNDSGGQPLDQNYGPSDLSVETLQSMIDDCLRFQAEQRTTLHIVYLHSKAQAIGYAEENAGHDFWLTRNGHGSGFWDREIGARGELLSEAARAFGECSLYVADEEIHHA